MEQKQEIALVTGASRGIGRAIALALGKTGRYVYINYLSSEKEAIQTLQLVEKNGGKGELLPFDVSNFASSSKAIHSIIEKQERIDIIINNAGIRKDMLMVWMKEEDWQNIIETNLNSFFYVTHLAVKEMLLKRSGRIINITSPSGQMGMAGQVNYSASKAGIIGATKALAKEIAKRKITVNAVSPGFIETDMLEGMPLDKIVDTIPMKRLGKPEEIASLVVFLCSKEASYITGQVIGINGGIV